MKENQNNPEVLTRATNATTRRATVRLDELVFDPQRYCHRPDEALGEEQLGPLMKSLVLEGLQVPVEFYTDSTGRKVVVKGHRRLTACKKNAAKNEPGFAPDMEIEAIEVLGATPEDLLIRSIADNEVRLNLDRVGRIKVSKKLYDAHVPVERAARAMGVSVKTYERDLLIAQNPWMFQHVLDKSVEPSNAVALLAEAQKGNRTKELKEDLDAWIAEQKAKIREREKLRRAQDGKDLRPAEKEVRRLMPKYLVAHWLELLRAKKRFDDDADWTFAAGIEPDTQRLHIGAVTLDLAKAPLDRLAKVASKLSLLSKQIAPVLRQRHESEKGNETSPAAAAYDLEYLKQLGLEDVAEELQEQARQAQEPDGEEDPGRAEQKERQEQDLSQEVQLPAAAVTTPTPEPPTPAQDEGKPDHEEV